jgi:hypothetical protein
MVWNKGIGEGDSRVGVNIIAESRSMDCGS